MMLINSGQSLSAWKIGAAAGFLRFVFLAPEDMKFMMGARVIINETWYKPALRAICGRPGLASVFS